MLFHISEPLKALSTDRDPTRYHCSIETIGDLASRSALPRTKALELMIARMTPYSIRATPIQSKPPTASHPYSGATGGIFSTMRRTYKPDRNTSPVDGTLKRFHTKWRSTPLGTQLASLPACLPVCLGVR
jgi:hypothetical protein